MSYKLAHAALHVEGLPTPQKIVLVAIADYYNDDTQECWPAQETIAHVCGLSRKTVNQAVKALTERGLIRQDGWHGKTPRYRLYLSPTVTPVTESYTNLSPTVTPPVTDGYTKVLPTVTQIDNINKENNKETNKQVSILESTRESNIQTPPQLTPTETKPMTPTQPKPASACSDDKFTLKDLALEARTKLIVGGMTKADAETRIEAVKDSFTTALKTLKAGGYAGISNRRKYLLAKLVGMAMDYKPPTKSAQAVAATDREGIVAAVEEYYRGVYPDQAQHIADWVQDAPNWIWTKFNGLMDARFDGRNPVTATVNIFRNWMTEQNNYASQTTASDIADMQRISSRKAEREAMEKIMRGEL